MLKKLVNEAHFTLRIETRGPLLVQSGRDSISGAKLSAVRTYRNHKQEVYIPGSSLKGVMRSHCEKIICSLQDNVVCYPFDNKHPEAGAAYRDSCGRMFTNYKERDRLEERTDVVYAASCPTCRLFGSTGFIGRIAIGDAYLAPTSEEQTEIRNGVGIDRLTGGAIHGAIFDLEVVSSEVVFETPIHLRNFEIWQLGMLFVVLQDMEEGLIYLGSGRSRGLGKVRGTIREEGHAGGVITSSIVGSNEPDNELWGLGRWLKDSSYGTQPGDFLTLRESVAREEHGIRLSRAFTGAALASLRTQAMGAFVQRMQHWPPQEPLASLLAANSRGE